MNKSIVLGLLMAMLVPTAAFADGHVSLKGDVRLRYEYSSDDGNDNGLTARTYINLGAKIDDNTSFMSQVRHGFSFSNDATSDNAEGDNYGIQQAYLSMADLGNMAGFLGGWSMDIGRMNNPNLGSGRIVNSADWSNGQAGPNNHDGFRLGSTLGGVDFDLYYWGNNDGSDANNMILNFDLGSLAGFADIGFYYVTGGNVDIATPGDPGNLDGNGDPILTEDDQRFENTDSESYMAFNINNIGGDALMGLDIDVEFATYDPDLDGAYEDQDADDDGTDDTSAAIFVPGEEGTLMTVSLGYDLDQFKLGLSLTTADEHWEGLTPHGTYGIADHTWSNGGADLEVTEFSVSTDALMDGMGVSLNYYSVATDSTGADIGTELDLLLDFSCGQLGFATVSFEDDTQEDIDYVYWQSSYDF